MPKAEDFVMFSSGYKSGYEQAIANLEEIAKNARWADDRNMLTGISKLLREKFVQLPLPGYHEPLDSENIDPDPNFRKTLQLLNEKYKITTVSSCQGHAPGTKYEDVQEWVNPYITAIYDGDKARKLCIERIMFRAGASTVDTNPLEEKILARFSQGWDWSESVKSLERGY